MPFKALSPLCVPINPSQSIFVGWAFFPTKNILASKLRAAIQEKTLSDFGSLGTRRFHLIESKLKPSGAEYTTVESFPFAAAEA